MSVTIGELGSTIIAYVLTPDGIIYISPSQPVVAGTNTLSPIIVTNPLFGNYNYGIQASNGLTVLGGNIVLSVYATRDATDTITYNGPIIIGQTNNQTQTSSSFAYGSVNVP